MADLSRRDEILTIAARCFADRGFAGVTVDDIGSACGVSGPALYHHFASKEAMLGEMLVGISEHLLGVANDIVADATSPAAALRDLVRSHVTFAVERPELITVHDRDLVHASDADRRTVRRLQRRYVEVWVEQLVARDGTVDPRRARLVLHGAFGLMNSTPHAPDLGAAATTEVLTAMVDRLLDPRWLAAQIGSGAGNVQLPSSTSGRGRYRRTT